MSQVQIVISEIFENVQYEIFYNGGSAQVMAATPDHKIGTSYSPLELFPDSPSARLGMQNELNNLLPSSQHDSLYPAIIRDAQYNIKSFQDNIEKLRLLAVYRSKDVKVVTLLIKGENAKYNECLKNVYISDINHADILGAYYASISCKSYVGYIIDHKDLNHLKTGHRHLKTDNLNILSKVAIGKIFFNNIPDQLNTPFKDSHLWAWLLETGYDGTQDTIETLRKYLRSLGFNRGLHKLDGENQFLSSSLHYYYDVNFKYKDHDLKVVK